MTPEDGMVLLTPEITDIPEATENQTIVEQVIEEQSAGDASVGDETAADDVSEGTMTDQQTTISVYTKYTVRNGDTLSKISLRYYGDFSKVAEICKINNLLEEDVIYPGQTILLP